MPRLGTFDRLDWLAIAGAGTGLAFVAFDAWILGIPVFVAALVVTQWRPRREGAAATSHTVRADGGEPDIELVTAVIRPGKLNGVKQALAAAGAPSLTVTNVSGRGTQPTETGQWRGEEYIVDLHQKVKVEVVVRDEATDAVVEAITAAAHTGEPGDGKIWVLPVLDAVRVSTEERGPEAV